MKKLGGNILEYEELINFILDGYDNKNLKKIVNQKKIKVMGSKEVSDRNRSIILKNLKTKNNLFIIFNLWNSSSKKRHNHKNIELISEENYKEWNNNDLSEFLYNKIEVDGMEETLSFWEENKNKLVNRQKENLIIKKTEKESTSIENDENQMKRNEKKHEKERQKWQISNNKLNQNIKQLSDDILKLESEKKEFQKKEYKISTDFAFYKKETAQINEDLEKSILLREKLKSEIIHLKEEIEKLELENIKKQEIIDEFKEENNKLIVSNKAIIKRNELLEKQKEEKFSEMELRKKQVSHRDELNSTIRKSDENPINLIEIILIGKPNFTKVEIDKLDGFGVIIIEELNEKLIFEKVKEASSSIWVLDYGTPEWIKLKILRDQDLKSRIKVISNHTKLIGELKKNGCIL